MTELVMVCGSRSINDLEAVTQAIKLAPFEVESIIHGGADGVDSNAKAYAGLHDIPEMAYKPNYEKHGRNAPLIRNDKLAREATKGIAVWDGESNGTGHAMDKMKEHGMIKVGEQELTDEATAYYFTQ